MNSYETLWFFGRIRGIPEEVLRTRIDALIEDVGLSKHAHRPCGNYSGGNKRKLSLAIALIGDPQLLLLDEPSSGMVRIYVHIFVSLNYLSLLHISHTVSYHVHFYRIPR